MTTSEAVARAIALLAASFPRWKVTEDTIDAWTLALGDLDPEQIVKAAVHHIRTSKFDPTVAEIRAHAMDNEGIPNAYEAWENMRRKWLSRADEPWCHPAAEAATRQMGGFEEMSATWTVDNSAANRARWIAAYEANLASGVARYEGEQSRQIAQSASGPGLVDFPAEMRRLSEGA